MILITGATGTIGRALVQELRAAGAELRAMARDPARAASILGESVSVVRGDLADAASLAPALDGARALFLLTAPGPHVADHDLAMMRAVQGSRVEKVVKMSAIGADVEALQAVSRWHRPGERAVMESGRAWTILRPAGFASNALAWAPLVRSHRPIEVATGTGAQAVVDPRDVAAVAARALTSRDHDGQGYTLTGPTALSAPDQIAILGRVIGREIAVEEVTPEVSAERRRAAGVPDAFVDAILQGTRFVREGKAATRTDTVQTLLGRAPRSFEAWARDHEASFR